MPRMRTAWMRMPDGPSPPRAPGTIVINETMARRHFPGEDPIGKRFTTPQTHGPVTVNSASAPVG